MGSLITFVAVFGLVFASATMTQVELGQSRNSLDQLRARHLAEAGVERGLLFLRDAVRNTSIAEPLLGLTSLFEAEETLVPFAGTPMLDGGAQVGAYTVRLTRVGETPTSITIDVTATGYLPDAPAALEEGRRVEAWEAVTARVRYALEPSEVFDYAYFINNWGWLYGSTIFVNGNARSNGQFDSGGYRPTITGQPIYDGLEWVAGQANLVGYRDDNGDGLEDGNDGGVYSGWDIVNAHRVKGNGGLASNQHDFQAQVEMPNLSDLSQYEASAHELESSIEIAGIEVCDGVTGDDAGESENLYLVGTAANPIVLDGPIVVRGDVIIKGVVTGQGAIYAGGNIYVPESITYADPPSSPRPADNTQAATEAWITANWDKDFLGLFSSENIVVGDHTNSTWRHYVGGWMGSSMNSSKEDAGADGIPNTRAGVDGILGTADDDVLEGDGVWTVEYYSAADEAMGLIPPGYSVGDAIPGSGEDIDGDGVYDGTISLADVTLTTPLHPSHWEGNMPPGGHSKYRDISSLYANNLDATFYTNHSFSYVVLGSSEARINGAIVSRNENIVYGTPRIVMNHDARLLGGASGIAASLLPRVVDEPVILRWARLEEDPNRYVGAP